MTGHIVTPAFEIFIDLIRRYEKETQNLNDAVICAIDECIKRNILREYLESNSSEVKNMLLTEWNWKDAEEVWKEEAREEEREETLKKLEKLIAQGVASSELITTLRKEMEQK